MVLPEGTELSKTYLLFSVKDQSPVLGEGLLLGEALLPLADIVKEDGDVSLKVSAFIFFRLRSSASSLYTCTIQFVVFLRLPPAPAPALDIMTGVQ